MKDKSIPDLAAYLMMKGEEAERAVSQLETVTDDKYSFIRLAIGEAMRGAENAMRAAFMTIDRLQTVAEQLSEKHGTGNKV